MAVINAVSQAIQHIFEARLSVNSNASGIGSGAAQTTLYITPYKGEIVTLFTGGRWRHFALTQQSASIPNAANTTHDIFLYDNSGTPALEFLAWTNDTTRVALDLQNGILVKGGDATRLYVGTLRTLTAGECTDDTGDRNLWNHYNRCTNSLTYNFNATSWTYATSNTTRYANNSSANGSGVVVGIAGAVAFFDGEVHHGTNDNYYLGVGDSSSTTFSALHQNCTSYNGGYPGIFASLMGPLSEGYHFLSINERQSNTTSTDVQTFLNSIARCKIFGIVER